MHRTAGFTLIELLVVIAIIAILASLLFPVFSRAREKGQQVTCLSNQRQVAMAAMMFADENQEVYPSDTEIWSEAVKNKNVLICPTLGKSIPNGFVYSSFVAGMVMSNVTEPTDEILIADGQNQTQVLTLPSDIGFRHNGRYIACFCDGHSVLMKELPPMWLVTLATLGEFNSEVVESSYPSLVFFTGGAAGSAEADFCTRLTPVIEGIALEYRLKMRVVIVNGDQFPELVQKYQITPGDPSAGYPTVIVFSPGGLESSRLAGFPANASQLDAAAWTALIAQCRTQIVDKVETCLNAQYGGTP